VLQFRIIDGKIETRVFRKGNTVVAKMTQMFGNQWTPQGHMDPKMAAEQLKAQMEQWRVQIEGQREQSKMAREEQREAASMALEREKAAHEQQLELERMQIERLKLELEARKLDLDAQLGHAKLAVDGAKVGVDTKGRSKRKIRRIVRDEHGRATASIEEDAPDEPGMVQ